MDEADKNLLAQSLKYLANAVDTAQSYLDKDDEEHAPEVLQIHINYVIQRITGMEKTISSINRRNKDEELALPDEAEEATELVRDLQIKQAEAMRR